MNDNKKIAINTVILAFKLVITMVCSFVVSRLILQALGADDYGLYNVVGGIVGMLALVSTSMVATSYRYIAVERGKGDEGNPNKVYSTLTLIHYALAVLLLVIGEPLGAFYIEHYLNITNASVADAQFVFVFSLIATFFTIVSVPSMGLLVAEEKFLPAAIIDIIRALVNVAIGLVLLYYLGNRLRLYAILMAALTILHRIAYQVYCNQKYPEIVKFKLNRNKQDYKEIVSFTGWMLLGASAVVGRAQGMAIVINLFFRNSINAGFGIANQIGNAVGQFANTLRQSVNPQIMKNQEGNSSRSLSLVYSISRYTYLIMLIVIIPLVLCLNTFLELWIGVGNVPPLTAEFTIFILLDWLVCSLKTGFDASIQATGDIKNNQIGYTIINLSIIPLVFFLYKIGLPAYINVIVGVVLSIVTLLFQASIMQKQTVFSYSKYLEQTIYPSLITTIIAFAPLLGLKLLVGEEKSLVFFLALISVSWTSAIVLFVGMNKNEREGILNYAKNKIRVFKHSL